VWQYGLQPINICNPKKSHNPNDRPFDHCYRRDLYDLTHNLWKAEAFSYDVSKRQPDGTKEHLPTGLFMMMDGRRLMLLLFCFFHCILSSAASTIQYQTTQVVAKGRERAVSTG
jgi:hypothetical protein